MKFLKTIRLKYIYLMISASKEILSCANNYQRYSSDDEEDETLPGILGFRRTFKSICKVCKETFRNPGPQETRNNTICFFCSSEIEQKSFEFYNDLKHKKIIFREKIPQILEEIKEVGMHPDRIYQTQLFEYYIFGDLQQLR